MAGLSSLMIRVITLSGLISRMRRMMRLELRLLRLAGCLRSIYPDINFMELSLRKYPEVFFI
jgi:hypothetical protein